MRYQTKQRDVCFKDRLLTGFNLYLPKNESFLAFLSFTAVQSVVK